MWSTSSLPPSLSFALRIWRRAEDHDVFGRAAQLSYYFLLAVFPALLFLTALLGLLADTGTELRQSLFARLQQVMPGSSYSLVDSTLAEISQGAGGGKLSLGVLGTIWAASKGMRAVQSALNVAYGVRENRGFWRVRIVAVVLTVAIPLLVIVGLLMVLAGSRMAEALAAWLDLSDAFTTTSNLLEVPLGFAAVVLAFNLLDHFAPARKRRWRWLTPGAVVGAALWLVASGALRIYLSRFGDYNATYGSLGAVIILMLWLYLTGAAILVVGEINGELEQVPGIPPAVRPTPRG